MQFFADESITLDGADAAREQFHVESGWLSVRNFLTGFAAECFCDLRGAGDAIHDDTDA